MIIKTRREPLQAWSISEYINLQGHEDGQRIFGCDATVSRKKDWNTGEWSKWTVSFGSCNDDIDFMIKRVKVINTALKLATKLNKENE